MAEPDETPGFSDAEVAEQIAPYLAEVDRDYAAQVEPLAKAIRDKDTSDDTSR